MTIQNYAIPSYNVGKVREKIEKMNRRAWRNKLPPLVLTVIGTHHVPDPNQNPADIVLFKSKGIPCRMIEITDFELNAEELKIAGWTFLGTLDHHTIPGSVIVQTVPGQVVPQTYFTAPAMCDHCKKIRRRTETFVVRNESGEEKQIGRNCLELFFGRDPHAAITHLQNLLRFIEEMSEGEERDGWFRGSFPDSYPIQWVLETVNSIIRQEGWVSKSMAQDHEGMRPTSSWISEIVYPPADRDEKARRYWEELCERFTPTERDKAEAQAAMMWWATEMQADSEYKHNCLLMLKSGQVPGKMFGYAASMVSTYQKAMNALLLRQSQKNLNEYLGTEKEKIEVQVRVLALYSNDGAWGVTTTHIMKDLEGRTLVWYKSGEATMDKGKSYVIRGTIKQHKLYTSQKNVTTKQTVLTRVKMVREVPEVEAPQIVAVGAKVDVHESESSNASNSIQ
jgi:hypothetical protein